MGGWQDNATLARMPNIIPNVLKIQMSFTANISQRGRSHVEDAEVRLAFYADVRRQEDLGKF